MPFCFPSCLGLQLFEQAEVAFYVRQNKAFECLDIGKVIIFYPVSFDGPDAVCACHADYRNYLVGVISELGAQGYVGVGFSIGRIY